MTKAAKVRAVLADGLAGMSDVIEETGMSDYDAKMVLHGLKQTDQIQPTGRIPNRRYPGWFETLYELTRRGEYHRKRDLRKGWA